MIKILTFAKALSRRNEFVLCKSAAIRENDFRFSTVCAPPKIRRRAQVTTVTNMIVVKTDTKREVSNFFKNIRLTVDERIEHWNDELIKYEKEKASLEEQLKQKSQILQALVDALPETDDSDETDDE